MQLFCDKDRANRDGEKDEAQKGLVQVMVGMRQHDRGQNNGPEFSDDRRAKDIAAELRFNLACFVENGKQHAEGGCRQDKPDEQRRAQESDRVKQGRENAA